MPHLHILIVSAIASSAFCSAVKPSSEVVTGESNESVKQRLDKIEEILEIRDTPDLVQKLKDHFLRAVEDAERRFQVVANQMTAKVEDVETAYRDRQNDISVRLQKLEERTSKQGEIIKKLSEMEMALDDVSRTLQNVQNRFSMPNDSYGEEDQSKEVELLASVLNLAHQIEIQRSKIETLQVKENLTRTMIIFHKASQRDFEEVIRKDITSSTKNLTLHFDEKLTKFQNIQSNLTSEMRDLQNSILYLENDFINANYISKLEERFEDFKNSTKDELQSIRDGVDNGVKQLGDLRNDVSGTQNTLRNLSSAIDELNSQLNGIKNCNTQNLKDYSGLDFPENTNIKHSQTLDIRCRRGYVVSSNWPSITCNNGTWQVSSEPCVEGSCSDPPSIQNGYLVSHPDNNHGTVVNYACQGDRTLEGNGKLECRFGEWKGVVPHCMDSYFDDTFYAEASPGAFIKCYSNENAGEIEFSKVLDNGSSQSLPPTVSRTDDPTWSQIDFSSKKDKYGVYQCGFSRGGRSMHMIIPLTKSNGELYFVDPFKVANRGDSTELQVLRVYQGSPFSIRWKHNGTTVSHWNGKQKVEIRNVQRRDAGTYQSYVQGNDEMNLLRLIVRKCKADHYGELCDQKCPPCYNGGVCHDSLGICVCPVGFNGNNCETACPENSYGASCSEECGYENCRFYIYCKPDPYGCSCARGFKGRGCSKRCDPGTYGADCKQECHCKNGPDFCNRFTGACDGGCDSSWTGESCQINVLG